MERIHKMASGHIFTDTSAWYAYIDKSDANHAAAVELVKNLDRPLITSNYIFDEILTLVKLRVGYHIAINLGQKLWNQEVAGLVRLTKEDESRAWEIFVQYEDKGFSFTDCTSFAIMERLKIDTAFVFDDHFIQYGKLIVIPT
ncbi:MAG: PIN domain-containing protein [Proteobacteria bacterium]|nr:PIN domain-containing protein [Pseudomonadota bacterium]MBU4259847.1 PIN domain-containing protein [Pseudomonadota bacterium]MBU4288353.1 PIN domain-containing protein [Pseudomonadota bacterium]MCG2758001.1 PIN domain-containing protein [Desulfobacteraceae bacterium]